MRNLRPLFLALIVGTLATLSGSAFATTPEDLNHDADQALHQLTTTNTTAMDVSKRAKAVLIFPNIVKAGLVFGRVLAGNPVPSGLFQSRRRCFRQNAVHLSRGPAGRLRFRD